MEVGLWVPIVIPNREMMEEIVVFELPFILCLLIFLVLEWSCGFVPLEILYLTKMHMCSQKDVLVHVHSCDRKHVINNCKNFMYSKVSH